MPEKKVHESCGKTVAHKLNGEPYKHACDARPDDPFETPGQAKREERKAEQATYAESVKDRPRGPSPFDVPKTESLIKGPWIPASYDSECDNCGGAMFAGDEIRADGQGGWECRNNCEYDETPHEDESARTEPGSIPVSDHRKWCTRCKLLGHYAADCETPMLDALPGPKGPGLSNPDLTRKALEALDRRTPEQKAETADRMDAVASAALGLPRDEPDPWEDPTEPKPAVNVSGQPDARYEWYGKQNRGYLVKLPETGDFRRYKNGNPRGLTRVTTFVKAASDSNALTDWAKRNVLIGASRRPDVVAKAHGLDHETGKGELMSLVGELETAAGAKVSADIGTLIHELTERWDGGDLESKDIPSAYRHLIFKYDETLKEHGLRPVPGLIERTTYIAEYGGVVGTLDRVYYHERSGQYLIGDVKTGKTLKYGMDEIESQEWAYAHGVNEHGVYDWNEDEWQPPGPGTDGGPVTVSEEWGVVIHMPVQGDDAGKVMLMRADLQRGRRHADVCHTVREERSNKPKPEPWTGLELDAPKTAADDPWWEERFSCVGSKETASELWQEAYDAGVPPERMERLKVLADERLAELAPVVDEWSWRFRGVTEVSEAGELWEEARDAGVEPLELNRLVGLAQQRLRELDISG